MSEATKTDAARKHQEDAVSSAIADVRQVDRARALIIEKWRSRNRNWIALLKDPEWARIEAECASIYRDQAVPVNSQPRSSEGLAPSGTPSERDVDRDKTVAELRNRAAVLIQQYGVPSFQPPEPFGLLRSAAEQLDRFVEDLSIHFDLVDGIYQSSIQGPEFGQPTPDAPFFVMSRISNALEQIDDAFRLMPLRNGEGSPLPDNRWAVWHEGSWRGSPPWTALAEDLLALGRTMYARHTVYSRCIVEVNSISQVRIPVAAAQLGRAWAECLRRLAATPLTSSVVPTAMVTGLPMAPMVPPSVTHLADPVPGHRGAKKKLRSWTQEDLDRAISEYKAARATSFRDLKEAVRQKRNKARANARKVFGRDAVARALGCKAPAMVSRSPVWVEIRDDLELQRSQARGSRRVGFEIGVEAASRRIEPDETPAMKEVLAKLKKLPREEQQALLRQLEAGETTPEKILQVIEIRTDSASQS